MKPSRNRAHLSILHVETGNVYRTYSSAAKAIGGNRWGVRYCCMGIQKQHKGQHFEYKRYKPQ